MLGRLLLIFLITPFVELALLIQVDRLIGFWPTMGVIVATGVVGSLLARQQGWSVWRQFNKRLQSGDLPGKEIVDGLIILVAGALLVTPGVLTDAIGFIGLIPFTRAPVRRLVFRRLKQKMEDGSVQMHVGGFGMASPSPNTPPSSEPSPGTSTEPSTQQSDPSWEGNTRDIPRHAEDENDADRPT